MPGLPQTWEKWANFTLHSPQVVAARLIGGVLSENSIRLVEIRNAHLPGMGALPSKSPCGERCVGMEHFRVSPLTLASVVINSRQPTWSRRFAMASSLKRVRVAPKGMGLNDFVAMQEGFFAAE